MYKALLKMRSKKGFTLMELLIVVAIIAILAAIAIPTFAGALTKAENAADEANARSLYAAVVLNEMTDGLAAPTSADASTEMEYDGVVYKFNTAPTINTTGGWSITTHGGVTFPEPIPTP